MARLPIAYADRDCIVLRPADLGGEDHIEIHGIADLEAMRAQIAVGGWWRLWIGADHAQHAEYAGAEYQPAWDNDEDSDHIEAATWEIEGDE